MTHRELQGWVVLAGCLLGAAFMAARLLGWADRIERLGVPWLFIGLSVLFFAALFWALFRSEPADERDLLIQFKSLSFAARILIFGLMGAMLLSGGGSDGAVRKDVINCLLAFAVAGAAARGLYLSRHSA